MRLILNTDSEIGHHNFHPQRRGWIPLFGSLVLGGHITHDRFLHATGGIKVDSGISPGKALSAISGPELRILPTGPPGP